MNIQGSDLIALNTQYLAATGNTVYINGRALLTGANAGSNITIVNNADGSLSISAAGGSSVSVSGVSVSSPNFTGINYIAVIASGNTVFISGTGNLNQFASNVDLLATGLLNAQWIKSLSGDLITSGRTLDNKINSLSGTFSLMEIKTVNVPTGNSPYPIPFVNTFNATPKIVGSFINNSGDPTISFDLSGVTNTGFWLCVSPIITGVGYQFTYFATTGDRNVSLAMSSAELINTGTTLDNKINSLSGFYNRVTVTGGYQAILNISGVSGVNASISGTTALFKTVVPLNYTMLAGTLTLTNAPAQKTPLTGAGPLFVDMTNAQKIRITAAVSIVGAAACKIWSEYSPDGTAWVVLETGLLINSTGLAKVGTWQDIPAGAKGDNVVQIAISGGDSAADPVVRHVSIQFI